MSASLPPDNENSEFWHDYLTSGRHAAQETTEVVSLHVGPAPR
ncbi:MAG: hypothetical protein ABI458_00430 [Chloroflexota bacterium]